MEGFEDEDDDDPKIDHEVDETVGEQQVD